MMEILIQSLSHVGERSRNEDLCDHGEHHRGWYAVLCDGAGGHANGALAARIAVSTAVAEMRRRADAEPLNLDALAQVVRTCHEAINAQQASQEPARRMHTTIVLLWIERASGRALWAHVGDSRLYALRRGHIECITHDDTVVQQMIDAGLVTATMARQLPNRHQLLRALGTEEPVDVNLCDGQWVLQDGDALLMCSDGWHDPLAPSEIEAFLASVTTPDQWLYQMLGHVLQQKRPNQDNLTAIAVWAGRPEEVTRLAVR